MALGYRRISRWLALVLAVSAGVTMGCRPSAPPQHPVGAPGKWYMVEEGETLGDIARRAGVPEEDLLELNGLHSAAEVQKGPADLRPRPHTAAPAIPRKQGDGPLTPQPRGQERVLTARPRFRWPVEAPQVTSLFGKRWGRSHEGIDLTAPIGTPVLAAGAGEVVYSGNSVRGYGNMVVLKHDADLMTVYAHNSVLFVKVGDRVQVGQRVALSGQSGHATGPHVHFEVRKGQVPRDPLPYLPELRTVGPLAIPTRKDPEVMTTFPSPPADADPRVQLLRARVRDIPDFPKPGILFRDLTPLDGARPVVACLHRPVDRARGGSSAGRGGRRRVARLYFWRTGGGRSGSGVRAGAEAGEAALQDQPAHLRSGVRNRFAGDARGRRSPGFTRGDRGRSAGHRGNGRGHRGSGAGAARTRDRLRIRGRADRRWRDGPGCPTPPSTP